MKTKLMMLSVVGGLTLTTAAPALAAEVVDGSFETQGTASPSPCFFGSSCAAGAWSGEGRSGIDVDGGAYGGTTPDGNYFGFIQSFNGGFGAISQIINFAPGTYNLNFLVAGRAFNGGFNGDTSYSVFLNNIQIFSGATISNMPFTKQTALFSTGGGDQTLTFRTAAASGDNTAFIDGVSVSAAVPEPATWAMMLLGFGFVGGAMRSAKRRQKLNVSYS